MKTTVFSGDLLLHIFNNSAIANLGDAGGLLPSAAPGSLYVTLHTGDPGAAGDQTTNEATYTGHNRVAVARSGAGWTVAANQVSNAALVTFAQCTGGTNTITHFGIGTAAAGAGILLYSGPLITTYYDFTGKASTDVITAPGHGLLVNDPVEVITMPNGTLPTGAAAGTVYYVLTVAGNDITISTSLGGATLDLTADGAGGIGKIQTLAVSNLITPQFGIGALIAAIEY
jgi:hypothetical protein